MRRTALVVMGLLVALVAGCSKGALFPTPTPVPPSPRPTMQAPSPTPLDVATPAGPATCVAVPMQLPEVSGISDVTEEDHVEGSLDARITLIEYADFQ